MSFDYINEAFRRLNSLTEDTFDTSLNGLNALADFREEDDVTDLAKVIDPEAETKDAISDSYIGKVIINCNVCHSHIFEAKEDVVVDEDGLVNPEMQCPYCGEMSGFTVVGEIQPFEKETSSSEGTEGTEDAEGAEEPVEESIHDKFKNDKTDNAERAKEQGLEESFRDTSITDSYKLLKDFLASKGLNVTTKDAIAYAWSVIDLFESGDIEVTQDSLEKWFTDTQQNYPEDLLLFEDVINERIFDSKKSKAARQDSLDDANYQISKITKGKYDSADSIGFQLATLYKTALREMFKKFKKEIPNVTQFAEYINNTADKAASSMRSIIKVLAKPNSLYHALHVLTNSLTSIDADAVDLPSYQKLDAFENILLQISDIEFKDKSTSAELIKNLAQSVRQELHDHYQACKALPLSLMTDDYDEYKSNKHVKLEDVQDFKKSTSDEEVIQEGAYNGGQAEGGFLDTAKRPGGHTNGSGTNFKSLDGKKTKTVKAGDLKPGMITDAGKILKVTPTGWDMGGNHRMVEISYGGIGSRGSYASDNVPEDRDYEVLDEELTESIDELSLTANGTHIEVDEDEDGRVTLVAEPAEAETGEMKISPVSDETVAEIEANNSEVATEDETTSSEEESTETEESEEVDVDIEEVEESDLDELGESYLKSTYRNVESFKTTSVSTTDSQLIVEGTVTFTSGNKKNTGFVFEAYSVSTDGKVKFIGSNKHFSESVDAFTLTGSVKEKKLLPESLSYNYTVGNDSINGTVNKK